MAMAEEEQEAGVAEWVVTFGDMMSLLLTFFVMLVSMSEIKEEQRQALIESLRQRFGHETATTSLMPGAVSPMTSIRARLVSMGRARRAFTMSGGAKVRAPVGETPRVTAIRPADDPTLGGVLYFDEGSSKPLETHEKTLEAIAGVIGGKPQKVEIRGHTSNRPLPQDSPHRSHWDLAYARCRKTMESLVQLGIDPKRFRIAVAARNEPVHLGLDETLRKKNARVEILMLDELTEDLDGTKKEKRQEYPNEDTP